MQGNEQQPSQDSNMQGNEQQPSQDSNMQVNKQSEVIQLPNTMNIPLSQIGSNEHSSNNSESNQSTHQSNDNVSSNQTTTSDEHNDKNTSKINQSQNVRDNNSQSNDNIDSNDASDNNKSQEVDNNYRNNSHKADEDKSDEVNKNTKTDKNHNDNINDDDTTKENNSTSKDLKENNINHNQSDELKENENRLDKLTQLRDKLLEFKKQKEEEEIKQKLEKSKLHSEKEEEKKSKEQKYELSEQSNNFINQLKELPSFEDRDRGAGYAIDTDGYTEVPDSVIRTLITKFLNQRFCKKKTDLNVRSNSLEKSHGFYKWEVKDVIKDLETHQITKVLTDKYGYQYAEGKNENVPLSFYFDMSGSMSSYTNMLAVIAIELLKKKVKVLIGYNERVNVQIESINGNIDVADLAKILTSAGYSSSYYDKDKLIKDNRVIYKYIDQNIDNYLIKKKAEKCVVFADFDPREEVINLSQKAEVYWFCFENSFTKKDLNNYNGFIYKVSNVSDLTNGLVKVNQNRFDSLCYTDNPEEFRKVRKK